MREEDKRFLCKWAYFRGFILTANEDGSIPLNADVVMDITEIANKEEVTTSANRIVAMHNEMVDKFR